MNELAPHTREETRTARTAAATLLPFTLLSCRNNAKDLLRARGERLTAKETRAPATAQC